MYNKHIDVKKKRRVNYILSNKLKHYTKEIIKLTNIIAIGIFIITAVILMKFKPVYAVYLDEQEVGCIEDKNEFEKEIEENLYNNSDENIAFSEINTDVKYQYKLIEKKQELDNKEVLLAIKEKSDITYFQYAVNVKGEERKYLKTEEEAKQVADSVRQELKDETSVNVETVYTKELNVETSCEIASMSDEILKEVALEEKKESSTINGIYLAVTPVSGHITSRYGSRESIRSHDHQGLDIATKTGTPIKAVADGTVKFSGEKSGYGNLIILDHGNGITTYYGHCSKLYVKQGEKVTAGDEIAAVGSTGNSTGPHLHFEIRKDGVYVNPQKYLYK